MLSISNPMKCVAEAVAYYLDERKENYYLNGIDKQGQWFGEGATRLGLGRTVHREEFRSLLNGFSPDGRSERVQNAGRPDRQACWDMTFNAPKPVSVLWALSPPELRAGIEAAHQQAVQTALQVAGEVGGITRRGPGGKIKEPAALLWATFQEGSSRAHDPHLHTHAVLLNLAQRADGTTGSLHTSNLFRWKMALGAIYQAQFAALLHQDLGLQIRSEPTGFGVQGVPQELCRDLSKRRQVIEQTMDERSVSGAVAAKAVAKDTRPKKEEVAPDRLLARWQAAGQAQGWGPDQAVQLYGQRLQALAISPLDPQVREAVEHLPAAKQTRSRLVREAARVAFEQGADGRTLFACLTELRLPDGQPLLWRPHWPGQAPSHVQENRLEHPELPSHEVAAGRERPAATPLESPRQETGHTHVAPGATQATREQPEPGAAWTPTARPEPAPSAEAPRSSHTQRPGPDEHGAGSASAQAESAGHSSRAQTSRDHGQSSDRGNAGQNRRPRGAKDRTQPGAKRGRLRKRFIRPTWKALYTKPPWIEAEGRLVRTRWVHPFERAWFGPARRLHLPTVAVELPRLALGPARPFIPRWWTIAWKKSLVLGELRVQKRILFRKAPRWSPLHGLSLPALRYSFRRSRWTAPEGNHAGYRRTGSGDAPKGKGFRESVNQAFRSTQHSSNSFRRPETDSRNRTSSHSKSQSNTQSH